MEMVSDFLLPPAIDQSKPWSNKYQVLKEISSNLREGKKGSTNELYSLESVTSFDLIHEKYYYEWRKISPSWRKLCFRFFGRRKSVALVKTSQISKPCKTGGHH